MYSICIVLGLVMAGCGDRGNDTTSAPGTRPRSKRPIGPAQSAGNGSTAGSLGWWEHRVHAKKCTGKVAVSGPAWEKPGANPQHINLNFDEMIRRQQQYLARFRDLAKTLSWQMIIDDHFDWWMFPCDFGSKQEFVVRGESDLTRLKSNVAWLNDYRESVRIVSRSLGWDIDRRAIIVDNSGGFWRQDKDIRLAKIIRSLWLLDEPAYLESLQKFAKFIQTQLYSGGGFWYGHCLDDMLLLKLPRPIPFTT